MLRFGGNTRIDRQSWPIRSKFFRDDENALVAFAVDSVNSCSEVLQKSAIAATPATSPVIRERHQTGHRRGNGATDTVCGRQRLLLHLSEKMRDVRRF